VKARIWSEEIIVQACVPGGVRKQRRQGMNRVAAIAASGAVAAFALLAGTASAAPSPPSVSIYENAQFDTNFFTQSTVDLQVTVSCPAGDFVTVRGTVTQTTSTGVANSGTGTTAEECSGQSDKLAFAVNGVLFQIGPAFAQVTACDLETTLCSSDAKGIKISL
jgi:hypothetical protein